MKWSMGHGLCVMSILQGLEKQGRWLGWFQGLLQGCPLKPKP